MPQFYIYNSRSNEPSVKNIKDMLQVGGEYAIFYSEYSQVPGISPDNIPLLSINRPLLSIKSVIDLVISPSWTPRVSINIDTKGFYNLLTHPRNPSPITITQLIELMGLKNYKHSFSPIDTLCYIDVTLKELLEHPEKIYTLLNFFVERVKGSGLPIMAEMLESIKTFLDIRAYRADDESFNLELEKLRKQTLEQENKNGLEVETINEQMVLEMGRASYSAGNANAFFSAGKFLEGVGKAEAAVQAYNQVPRGNVSFKMACYQAAQLCTIKLKNPRRALYYYLQALRAENNSNSEISYEIKFNAMRCLSSIFAKELPDEASSLILDNIQGSGNDDIEGINLDFVTMMANFTLDTLEENRKLKEEIARMEQELSQKAVANSSTSKSSSAEPILRQYASSTAAMPSAVSSTVQTLTVASPPTTNINNVSKPN